MNTQTFIDRFNNSDFAKKNIFSHLQTGLPVPALYKGSLGIIVFLHKLSYNEERIVMSAPCFEARLIYPSERIYKFEEIDKSRYASSEIVIPKSKIRLYKSAVVKAYEYCDDILDFYDRHSVVTPMMIRKNNESLKKAASDIGMDEWYGGAL